MEIHAAISTKGALLSPISASKAAKYEADLTQN